MLPQVVPDLTPIINKARADPNVLAIVVFGSYTQEEYYRDIDICLFLYPSVSPKNVLAYVLAFDEIFDFSIFSDLPLYIQARVMEEGQILLNKDYNGLFDIYINAIKEYNLFKPHYDAFLRAVADG